ncbi:hypothetical protein TTHERM_00334390 (macronuclear) [Tetrahymena thermophila SB210]|uniref:Uncharacterized protein n=1 Tax=Tetrahymena thermophila (strain SB210) TaxID=312017 RepID=I7M1N9_TETTS|nr:hypothetical protein TTHERM_00334390 [Tetrahymena thermophila SB210]EAR97262.1 hypothetical protein TTHERM_00334390 [Tetrahymena thermophila SB210]|eukprot:XP_001017507.1 hypothetical protein TTHERM_00334390 [Tetrahymena thermophila SB210]
MQYITEPIYNAYCYVWNYFYSVPQDYDCDPTEAQKKLDVLIMEIQTQIQIKKQRNQSDLNELKLNFSKHIHSEHYQEQIRTDFCRKISNKNDDINMLNAINEQIEKLKQFKTQLITLRKDQEYLKQIMPTIENLVFAASYDGTLQIKLVKFTDFLQYLWGKEYTIPEENNLVEKDFKQIMTKISTDEDYEKTCLEFSSQSLVHPQLIYRCNPERSVIYSQQSNVNQISIQNQGIQMRAELN